MKPFSRFSVMTAISAVLLLGCKKETEPQAHNYLIVYQRLTDDAEITGRCIATYTRLRTNELDSMRAAIARATSCAESNIMIVNAIKLDN